MQRNSDEELANGMGTKKDEGKPRMSLIAPEFIWELAKLLTRGAKKYKARNWEAGMDWDRPADAIERHFIRWKGGEDLDPETGISHMVAIACNAMFLFVYHVRSIGNDNRQKVYVNQEPTGEPDDGPTPLSKITCGDETGKDRHLRRRVRTLEDSQQNHVR